MMIPNIQKTHCVRYSYLTWVYSAWVSQAHTSVPKNQESEQKIAVKMYIVQLFFPVSR